MEYASSYRLNKSFEFVSLGKDIPTMHPSQWYPTGPHVVVSAPDLRVLLEHYKFWTVDQLLMISEVHLIPFSSSSKKIAKSVILNSMHNHTCHNICKDIIYTFKTLRVDRRTVRHTAVEKVPQPPVLPVKRKRIDQQNERKDNPKKPRIYDDDMCSERKRVSRSNMSTEQTEAAKEKNREEHQNSYETKAAGKIKADVLARANFPIILGDTEKADIIKEWQSEMDLDNWVMKPCAVCSQRTPKRELSVLNHEDVDFRLLQNPHLPNETLPTTYNLLVYEYAILNPNALHDRENLGALDVCRSCETELVDRNRQPKNALANWHYSGFDEIPIAVQKAFKDSSMFDLMMVARCRSTRITQLYLNKKGSPNYQGDASESQRYDRGNVSIIPQDSVTLRPMLPPDDDEIRTTMAALFTGSRDRPTAENISKFSPVLVSKTRIKIILDFLLSKNMWYRNSGTVFSADNYDNLFGPDDKDKDEAVPRAVDLCWLPPEASKIKEGGTADYTDRNEFNRDDSDSDVVMEAVGYTAGDRTPQNYRVMKASALAWCLARKKFIKMKGASELLSDNDTAFLTYLFPHLDPWGIMGFKQSERTESQRISFDQQVKNYLLLHDSPFQADPNFAYVCWNVMQKREVNKTACFRTSAQNQASIVAELTQIGPTIPDLIQKWEKDPMAKPSNREEKRALKLLNKIKLVAKELKGSSGYKLCRRNEIRALMKKYSTPALFVTINPADVYHPLLGVMGGKEAEEWRAMSRHEMS